MNWPPDRNAPGTAYSTLNIPSPIFQNSQFHNIPQNTNQTFKFETRQKQKDAEFINEFIKNKVKKTIIDKIPSTLKIFEAKKYLKEIISLKLELEVHRKTLDVYSNDFDMKWDEIMVKKNKINTLLLAFDDSSLLTLKHAVQKRKKKRNWERRRKVKERSEKIKLAESLIAKHALIDQLLSKKSKEVESVKRTEALRRQADSVLHEVRRKKYEAKKMTNMLSALSKLRKLRIQKEVAQGGYCSNEITETFNNVISQFQELWKKQSEMYNLEEKGLKVMLEESEIPQMKISNFQKIINQWEEAFFGTPSLDDNYRYLTAADDDINSLIFVRREWDQYASTHSTILSSCIPVGWVSPPETDNEEWKAFLRVNKKQKC